MVQSFSEITVDRNSIVIAFTPCHLLLLAIYDTCFLCLTDADSDSSRVQKRQFMLAV